MRWIFYINNGGDHYAEMTYDWEADKYSLELLPNFGEHIEESPLMLQMIYEMGERSLDDRRCRMFIRDRVVPSGRHNIGMFLREMKVPYYHECFMLRAMPKCVMDDARVDFVKEVSSDDKD